jgi:hypothetical protein
MTASAAGQLPSPSFCVPAGEDDDRRGRGHIGMAAREWSGFAYMGGPAPVQIPVSISILIGGDADCKHSAAASAPGSTGRGPLTSGSLPLPLASLPP